MTFALLVMPAFTVLVLFPPRYLRAFLHPILHAWNKGLENALQLSSFKSLLKMHFNPEAYGSLLITARQSGS